MQFLIICLFGLQGYGSTFLGENSITSNGVVYSNVPSFDLIVRPVSSNIDISFILDNGLSYSDEQRL